MTDDCCSCSAWLSSLCSTPGSNTLVWSQKRTEMDCSVNDELKGVIYIFCSFYLFSVFILFIYYFIFIVYSIGVTRSTDWISPLLLLGALAADEYPLLHSVYGFSLKLSPVEHTLWHFYLYTSSSVFPGASLVLFLIALEYLLKKQLKNIYNWKCEK